MCTQFHHNVYFHLSYRNISTLYRILNRLHIVLLKWKVHIKIIFLLVMYFNILVWLDFFLDEYRSNPMDSKSMLHVHKMIGSIGIAPSDDNTSECRQIVCAVCLVVKPRRRFFKAIPYDLFHRLNQIERKNEVKIPKLNTPPPSSINPWIAKIQTF